MCSSDLIMESEELEASNAGRKPVKKFRPLPVHEIITPAVVDEIFAKYDSSLKVLRYECAKGTKNGDNYLSLMYAVDVQVETTTTAEDRGRDHSQTVFHLMFKTIPRNPVRIAMVQPLKLFQREILMYTDVLAAWRSWRNFHSFPKCLHALYKDEQQHRHENGDGPRTDYIVMENVRHDG